MANKFESGSGLNVNNHYGAFTTGGTEGVVKTEGVGNEFMIDLDNTDLELGFPVGTNSIYVTFTDDTLATGLTSLTIGGVEVIAASSLTPVEIPSSNTGVIVTDATAGKILVSYNKYSLV